MGKLIMIKVLRNSKVIPTRGGGPEGWHRPTLPILDKYELKRPISVFQGNMWLYDGTSPQWIFDNRQINETKNSAFRTCLTFFGGVIGMVVFEKWLCARLYSYESAPTAGR